MDIKELEFVRDFYDHLCEIHQDLLAVSIAMDQLSQDENVIEIPHIAETCISSVCHQADLMKSLFLKFKDSVDQKYWNEWRRKHPHMRENYNDEE